MRELLNKSTLTARAGFNIIEVFPCAELSVDAYTFKPMNGTCTKEIPIVFQAGKEDITGYMDIYTNEIHEVPTIEDCSLAQEMPLSVGNQTYLYNGETGNLKLVNRDAVPRMQLHWSNFSTQIELESTVFKELIMYKLTDFQSKIRLSEIINTFHQQNKILNILQEQNMRHSEEADAMSQNIVRRGLFAFFWDLQAFDIFQIWIFLVCCKVTITIFVDSCLPQQMRDKITLNIPALFQSRIEKRQDIEMDDLTPNGPLQRQAGHPSKKCVRFSDEIEERILEEVRKSPEPKDQASTSHKHKQGFKSTDSYFYKVTDAEMEADPLTGTVGEGA
ncbi:MAG: hypothetical protein GY816_16720, partial [Cytophagales bacterium]|nr:hypothetical protein [Cytophagales bacterium]